MPHFEVVFKPETALAPELVEAAGAVVLVKESLIVFEPLPGARPSPRAVPLPLRFLQRVTEEETGRVVYQAEDG